MFEPYTEIVISAKRKEKESKESKDSVESKDSAESKDAAETTPDAPKAPEPGEPEGEAARPDPDRAPRRPRSATVTIPGKKPAEDGAPDPTPGSKQETRPSPTQERKPSRKAGEKPAPSKKERPGKKASADRRDTALHRDFIIAYDGAFIGHFRSSRRITNRTAFVKVARTLMSSIEGFEIRRLELYKPVPLKVEFPDAENQIGDGSFHWFTREDLNLPEA